MCVCVWYSSFGRSYSVDKTSISLLSGYMNLKRAVEA